MKRPLHSRADRRAISVLALVVLVVIGGVWLYQELREVDKTSLQEAGVEKDIQEFEEQLRADSAEWRKKHPNWYRDRPAPETFPFDPNTADSLTLLRLGLAPWQVHNNLRYRAKGGRWRSAEDFSRLYGLADSTYQRLKPYIRIGPDPRQGQWDAQRAEWDAQRAEWDEEKRQRQAARDARQAHYDSLRATYPKKYAEGTVIDLNQADTTALKGVPGIGSVYARTICAYRERLGGFVSTKQLSEITSLPPDLERWFSVSPHPSLRKINVNKATFRELVHHPYLNYEQTKEIVNYIRLHGPLHGWQDLRLSTLFSEKDFQRLAPYFTF